MRKVTIAGLVVCSYASGFCLAMGLVTSRWYLYVFAAANLLMVCANLRYQERFHA